MKKTITAILLLGAALLSVTCSARKPISIKPHFDFSLGNPYHTESSLPELKVSDGKSLGFGVDAGMTFFSKARWSLTANAGICWNQGSQKFGIDNITYSYDAGPNADIDGDSYVRHTTVSNLEQEVKSRYITVSIYLDADFQVFDRLSVYGRAGFRPGFSCGTSTDGLSGSYEAYGVYPQYDNLVIDDSMNDFGSHAIDGNCTSKAKTKGMVAQVLCGAGIKFNIFRPLWLEAGVNYIAGGSILKCAKKGATSADNMPVTYTVADGVQVRNLASVLTKNCVSQLSLSIGLIYRF